MNIYKKLHNITHELKSLEQERSKGVPYPIISFNEVNSKLRDLLLKHGVLIIPNVLDHTKEGNLTIVKMNAEIIDIDNPNTKITVGDYIGYGVDNSDKGIGKAISYANKYILMKLFMMNIGADEESEHTNPQIQQTKLGKKESEDII